MPEPDREPNAAPLPQSLTTYLPPALAAEVMDGEARLGLLLDAQRRLASVQYLLGTHLPQSLVAEVAQDPEPGRLRAQPMEGTLLFADVSGFTALSERLAAEGRQGTERLTDRLNAHFERMVEILIHSGGQLMKYAGDAMLAYFPALDGAQQAQWAVRAGHRMLRALADPSGGGVVLRMKVGIATGPFYALSVGTARRMEYVLLGETVTRTLAAEKAATAGQVLVDAPTGDRLPPAQRGSSPAPGFFIAGVDEAELGDFEIRTGGRRRSRSTVSWMSGRAEVVEQLAVTLRQVEALTAYLPAVLARRIIATMDARHLPGENRPVAVLFLHARGIDPGDEGREGTGGPPVRLLSDYFRTVQRVVARYEGVVSRVDPYGDGSKFLILFGAPVAHEDDPQRAVRAALEIDAGLADLRRRWQHLADPPPVRHQMGLAYGPTFAGQVGTATHREYTVMGDDVNLAARLMAAAAPGQVLASDAVRVAVGGHARFAALPPMRVRGKAAPLDVWQVEALRDDRLARRVRDRAPLVGRGVEWKRAAAVLEAALAGRGTRLTIRGEAGVGKSHLADALAGFALERGVRVLPTASAAYLADTPYAAWAALVETAAGIERGDPPAVRSGKLEALLNAAGQSASAPLFFNLLGLQRRDDAMRPVRTGPAAPGAGGSGRGTPNLFNRLGRAAETTTGDGASLWDLARRRREDAPSAPQKEPPTGVPSGGPEGDLAGSWQRLRTRVRTRARARLFGAVLDLLRAMAGREPLMLIFEDAQWMDAPSRALLDAAADRLADAPLLLLEVARGLEAEGGDVLLLEPLAPAGTTALIAQLLHDTVAPCPPAQLADAVHPLTGGNPLFIQEVIRWLRRTHWSQIDRLDAGLRASSMLQELVLSRLDALPYEVGEAARAAAVAGEVVTAAALAPVLGAPDDALRDALAQLQEAGWLLPLVGETEGRYRFRQPLVREMIYDSLPQGRRREYHEALAAYWASRDTQGEGSVAVLAHHLVRAGAHRDAAVRLLAAGLEAEARGVLERARAYYAQACDCAQACDASFEVCELRGDAALLLGDLASAEAAYRAAEDERHEDSARLQDAPSPQDTPRSQNAPRLRVKRAVVYYSRAETHYRDGETDAARDLLRQAEAWLEASGGVPDVTARVRQALAKVTQGRADRWHAPGLQRQGDRFVVVLRAPGS